MEAELNRLVSRADLNGSKGWVKSWIKDKTRWQVVIGEQNLCVKSINLIPLSKNVASFEFEEALLTCDVDTTSQLRGQTNCQLPFNSNSAIELISQMPETDQSIAICTILIQSNAIVTRSARGLTPLWLASETGNPEIIKLLLGAKADPDILTEGSNFYPTALTIANREGNVECVRILLQGGADPHIGIFGMRTDSDSNPLNSIPMVRDEIVWGNPDPNRKDMLNSHARQECANLIEYTQNC